MKEGEGKKKGDGERERERKGKGEREGEGGDGEKGWRRCPPFFFFFSEKETSTNLSLSRVDGSHCSTAVLKRTKLCVVSIPVAPSFCSASAAANFSKPELVERATTTISVFGSTPPVRFLFAVVNEQDHILKKGQQPQVVLPPVFVFVLTPTQKPDF